MRREDWFFDNAKRATFSIVYYGIIFATLIPISIFVGWGWIFLSLGFGLAHGMSINDASDVKRLNHWTDGPKRKFRSYMSANNRAYVETKVGFFWIPIWTYEELEPEIFFDKRTGEKIENHRYKLILRTWDSPTEAMEWIHQKRGFSSATLQGEFEA